LRGKPKSVRLQSTIVSASFSGSTIAKLEAEMRAAAKKFEFERAAELRDKARELRAKVL